MSRSEKEQEFWELPDRRLKKTPQGSKSLKQVILPLSLPLSRSRTPAAGAKSSSANRKRSTVNQKRSASSSSAGQARKQPGARNAPAKKAPAASRTRASQQKKTSGKPFVHSVIGAAKKPAQPKPKYSKKPLTMPSGKWFFSGAFVVILLLSGVITAIMEAPEKIAAAQSLSASAAAAESAALAEELANQVVAGEEVGPVYQENWTMRTVSTDWVRLPENGRVDMSYFNDVLFVGDSLTQGFTTYTSNGFENAKFAAYIGAGPKTFIDGTVVKDTGESVRPLDEVIAANAKKVYILLGTNALETMSDEGFLQYYGQMLDLFNQNLPTDTIFYVQSIPPATAERIAENEKFALERVQGLNQQIAKLAYDRGMYFLDLYEALADDTGALSAAYSAGDGLHLNADGYGAWREYLITHTVYRPGVLYVPGSPYYTAAPAV